MVYEDVVSGMRMAWTRHESDGQVVDIRPAHGSQPEARTAGTCTVRSSSPGPRVEIDGARQTGSSYSSASGVSGCGWIGAIWQGADYRWAAIGQMRLVAMRVNGFWVVVGGISNCH